MKNRIILTLEDYGLSTNRFTLGNKVEDSTFKEGDMVRILIQESHSIKKMTPYIAKVVKVEKHTEGKYVINNNEVNILTVEITQPDTEADSTMYKTDSFAKKEGDIVEVEESNVQKIL